MDKTVSEFKLIDDTCQPIKYCKWCGAAITELIAPNQKYCDPKIRDCQKKAYNENARKRMANFRERWKGAPITKRPGTTTLGLKVARQKNGEPDFDREMRIIRAERNRYLSNNSKHNRFYAGKQ